MKTQLTPQDLLIRRRYHSLMKEKDPKITLQSEATLANFKRLARQTMDTVCKRLLSENKPFTSRTIEQCLTHAKNAYRKLTGTNPTPWFFIQARKSLRAKVSRQKRDGSLPRHTRPKRMPPLCAGDSRQYALIPRSSSEGKPLTREEIHSVLHESTGLPG